MDDDLEMAQDLFRQASRLECAARMAPDVEPVAFEVDPETLHRARIAVGRHDVLYPQPAEGEPGYFTSGSLLRSILVRELFGIRIESARNVAPGEVRLSLTSPRRG